MNKVKEYYYMTPKYVDAIQYTGDNIDDVKDFLGFDGDNAPRYAKFENGKLYFRQNTNNPEYIEVLIGDYITVDHEYFYYSVISEKYFTEKYFEIQK